MPSLSKLATTLALLLHTLSVLAIPDGKTTDLQKVFNIDLANDNQGGCKGDDGSIEKGYKQALEVLNHAIGSLDWLSNLKEEPKPTAKEDYEKFLKITQAWKLLLGAREVWTGGGVGGSVRGVRDTYEKYLQAHQIETNAKEPNFYLRCSDHWLEYLPPNTPDPRLKDQSKTTIAKQFPHGAMLAPGLPTDLQLVHVDAKPADVKEPWCHGRVKAVSNRPNKLLILCPKTYMLPPYGASKYAFPTKADDVDVGHDTLDMADKVMAVTWIHEMGHYVMGWPEPNAPDPSKKSAMEPVYDLDMAMSLSKSHEDGEMPWPENLALFAAAVYMDEWYWGSGVAKSTPEEVVRGGQGTGKTTAMGRQGRLFEA